MTRKDSTEVRRRVVNSLYRVYTVMGKLPLMFLKPMEHLFLDLLEPMRVPYYAPVLS